jgi:glycogen debranching enzyme
VTKLGGTSYPTDQHTPFDAAGSSVTIVAGNAFLICEPSGNVRPGGVHGYFAEDTRLLDRLVLRVDGVEPRLLRSELQEQVLRSVGTHGDPTAPDVLVVRQTRLGAELIVDLVLENLTSHPLTIDVEIIAGSDFADLFDVKRGSVPRAGFVGSGPIAGELVLSYESDGFRRSLRVVADEPVEVLRDGLRAHRRVGPRAKVALRLTFQPTASGAAATAAAFEPADSERWEASAPVLTSSLPTLAHTWRQCVSDLAALLLTEPAREGRLVVAAGSPWFMTLFGRDSLLTSWSALLIDPNLAVGCLGALAERQGTSVAPASAEEPGRILHELRAGEVVLRPDGWGAAYYGSVDATPLFVMLLREVWRWGAGEGTVRGLLPAAEAAVAWILNRAAGDGFVWYGHDGIAGTAGLANQGWKDSDDAVRHADGSVADGPIALVEVQAYAWAALEALADLRDTFATDDPAPLRERAGALRQQLDERFWMPDEDCYAMALGANGQPVRSVTSNAGHVLWAGAALPERAVPLAERLLSADMFSGWGIRTLSSANPAYNPLSYHCGSVWPHDSALIAAGMLAGGCRDQGRALALALLQAFDAFGGRPPELFGGFSADDFRVPVPYPSSCSPQAWAAGAPALLVRALLGLRPDPGGDVHLDPYLPDDMTVTLHGVAVGSTRRDIAARGQKVTSTPGSPLVG